MKEFILTLLSTVLTVAIPLITAYLVAFLRKKSAQSQAQMTNDTAKRYLKDITDAVATAVSATSQTYVDALKKDNAFTAEAQIEALSRAKQTIYSVLAPAALEFIGNTFGDLDAFLTAKIEESVKQQKITAAKST